MNNPANYPRRILLAVTGLSPQVVTETIYALAVRRELRFVPTEVHLITTREGAERSRLALLSDDPGWFHRLCRDYGLPEITFDNNHIHVLKDERGVPLDDIRSPEDNERAADFITETVRELTADQYSALHISIAGGRKTMGFYLGYALSLFGRTQDRLSHVLVSDPFESSWEFFYPTPYSRVITTRDNTLADTAKAEVTIAEIPFVALRHGLPERLLAGRARFSDAVAAASGTLAAVELVLDLGARRVCAAGKIFRLPPAELALLSLFARLATRTQVVAAPNKGAPDKVWAERYLSELRAVCGNFADLDETERALKRGMDGDYFSVRLSKLRRSIRAQLGLAATPYLIDDGGTRPRRYRLALPPEAIRYEPIEASFATANT